MSARSPQSAEFIAEAKEHLAVVCDELLRFERASGDALQACLEAMLRAVHSVKGGGGFFGFKNIEAVAHRMESVLELAMDGAVRRDGHTVDALLAATDRIAALLDDPERSDQTPVDDTLARLDALMAPSSAADAPTDELAPALTELEIDLTRCEAAGIAPLEVLARVESLGEIHASSVETDAATLADWSPATRVSLRVSIATSLSAEECLRRIEAVEAEESSPSLTETSIAPPSASVPAPADRGGTIRVSVGLADQLMDLAGELVLVRNQSRRYAEANQALPAAVMQRFDAVTSAFQGTILQTRMQPVANLFNKFPRLVRDLARQLGKQIELHIVGGEVELDKTILDAISDPLTHLVRNACDHGIEAPADREASGKPVVGRIELSTRHYGDQIGITINDDGRGIDRDAIRRQAIKQGLRTAAELERLPDRELFGLILLPGFSTAKEVSEVSGRGVGMDVVKTNLVQLGGAIEIDSVAGAGTTFTLRLPLTLAIIPSLLVTAAGERYAIPQKDLQELVCVDGEQTRARIECTPEQEVLRLRGRLLPLVRLRNLLAALMHHTGAEASNDVGPCIVAIVKAGERRFALAIDSVLGSEEIVVKPMHPWLRELAMYSGATILGDGRAALILSTPGVALAARIRFGADAETQLSAAKRSEVESQAVLLLRDSDSAMFAVPVSQVRRIVMVRRAQFERLETGVYVTIDGVPVRLALRGAVDLSSMGAEILFVLLPREAVEAIGLVVQEVLGTEPVDLDQLHPLPGDTHAYGATTLRERITPIFDLPRLLGIRESTATAIAPASHKKILLVDDTKFFRDVVGGYLEAAGYMLTQAEHGAEGLDRLERGSFDLVVSDLEMPVMDGWTFASSARLQPRFATLPMLALTTLTREQAEASALAAGFTAFEVKLDQASLLATIARLLANANRAAVATGARHG